MADHRLSIKRHRGKYPRISSTPEGGRKKVYEAFKLRQLPAPYDSMQWKSRYT